MALSPAEADERRSASPGPLEDIFFNNTGRLAHKWVHYLPVYDRVIGPYRAAGNVRMLEIGVSKGGSLEMWRKYFGPDATIFGVDINPECATVADPPNQVRIGSQADPAFLRSVVGEMGAPNIILDDGSHVASHQRISFQTLFPLLQPGGIYIIEDLHTAYYGPFEGGYRKNGTGVELVKELVDDQHAWHHGEGETWAPCHEIGSIQVFDSIAVIEKVIRPRPGHFMTGEG